MARLYANENVPLGVVQALRHFGHDVLTSQEAGRANQSVPDEAVLDFAARDNRIMLTLNRNDFIQLHRINPLHKGIIVCSNDTDFEGQAQRIHHALLQHNTTDSKLFRVNKQHVATRSIGCCTQPSHRNWQRLRANR